MSTCWLRCQKWLSTIYCEPKYKQGIFRYPGAIFSQSWPGWQALYDLCFIQAKSIGFANSNPNPNFIRINSDSFAKSILKPNLRHRSYIHENPITPMEEEVLSFVWWQNHPFEKNQRLIQFKVCHINEKSLKDNWKSIFDLSISLILTVH